MKRILQAAAIFLTLDAVALALDGCAPGQVAGTVGTVCADVAALDPAAKVILAGQPPSSKLGVLWADVQSGCAGAAPATGVSIDWTGMVFGMLKAAAPIVLPALIGLL